MDATAVSQYTPDEYERTCYYNGIVGAATTPNSFTPEGRFACIPEKQLRGVFGTPLNGVWGTVGPDICDLIKARKINWSSIDTARFFTRGEEKGEGTLGPVVIWVGVIPGSTSSDTAHEVSQEILALLLKNGVEDVVVEWRESVTQRLTGPPLMRHGYSSNATHYVRRFLTALLGIPLSAEGREEEDAQGTLTLWFHENKDEDGNPGDKVYGVSNCHVLRKNTTVEYNHRRGAPKNHVRVCGMHRFQQGLDETRKAIDDHASLADSVAENIVELEAKENQDTEDAKYIPAMRRNLEGEKRAVADLEALYDEVTRYWSDMNFHRNIGHVQYAAPVKVDVEGGTLYTSDWAAFLADEAKVKDEFEGNVVDLGSKISIPELTKMFNPPGGRATTFKYPSFRKLRIEGCATEEDLANPAEIDSEGQRCIKGKDGNTTDLTVGRYAGLVSFIVNEDGVESVELGIYNSGVKYRYVEPFSAKGDSGSLVWCIKNGKAHIVGQLHSGNNKGGSTGNYVTYCTPGWYLMDQIKKKFKHADFYRDTWSA